MKDSRTISVGDIFLESDKIFEISRLGSRPYEFVDRVHFTIAIEMNLNLRTIDREVYQTLDLVGDTGGVSEGLKVIFATLLLVFNYKSYDTYMVA